VIIIIITANVVLPGDSVTAIKHNTQLHIYKIAPPTQTKHSTRSYTNNKGHIIHNEYNKRKYEGFHFEQFWKCVVVHGLLKKRNFGQPTITPGKH
jgi:hypothetical protein